MLSDQFVKWLASVVWFYVDDTQPLQVGTFKFDSRTQTIENRHRYLISRPNKNAQGTAPKDRFRQALWRLSTVAHSNQQFSFLHIIVRGCTHHPNTDPWSRIPIFDALRKCGTTLPETCTSVYDSWHTLMADECLHIPCYSTASSQQEPLRRMGTQNAIMRIADPTKQLILRFKPALRCTDTQSSLNVI